MSYQTGRHRPRLLVVDDELLQRTLLREALEPHGFELIEAADGPTAIDTFSKIGADLVLLDVLMPDMDGFATCRAIRALPGGGNIPILMATALEDIDSIETSYDAGATDFVSKPINWGLLPHRIRYLLRSNEILHKLVLSERYLGEAQRLAQVGNLRWSPPSFACIASAEAARIFGYEGTTDPLSLRSILRRLAPSDRPLFVRALRQLQGQQIVELDLRLLPGRGGAQYISLRAERSLSPTRRPVIQATCHDITERKRSELELQKARDEALQADTAKTTFLGTMSHELRTPLNGIIGFAELLVRQALGPIRPKQYVECAEHILAAGRRMYASIDDVLTMTQLASGKYECRPDLFELPPLVRSVVAAFTKTSGRSIAIEAEDALLAAFADQRDVRRMLENLLSNAVKFSTVETPIRVTVDRAEDGHCRLSVKDHGIGMTPDEAERAVQIFRQSDERLSRASEGMGLGLSITNGLILLNGGQMQIISQSQQGTLVVLHLPRFDRGADIQGVGIAA